MHLTIHTLHFKGHHLSIHYKFITFKLNKYTKMMASENCFRRPREPPLLGVFLGCVFILHLGFGKQLPCVSSVKMDHIASSVSPVLLWAPAWCFGSEIVQECQRDVSHLPVVGNFEYTHYQCICITCYSWSSCCQPQSWNFKAFKPSILIKSNTTGNGEVAGITLACEAQFSEGVKCCHIQFA